MRPKVVAIVPAAGFGKRLKSKTKKPLVLLRSKPLISYALAALERSGSIDAVIVAAEISLVNSIKKIISRFGFKKVKEVVAGGSTRFESVRNCLARIGPEFDIVLIHDGARPFLEGPVIADSVRLAARYGACVVAVPESDTVKLAGKDLFIKRTLDRNNIYRAQTPQVFRRELIVGYYKNKRSANVTDDAQVLEMAGKKIKILKGTYRNIKITTKEDLKLAEVLL